MKIVAYLARVSVIPFLAIAVSAAEPIPDCMIDGLAAPIDNAQVLTWKFNTPNQFKARAHVVGKVLRIFKPTTKHDHFEIELDAEDARQVNKKTLEVIYRREFGKLAGVKVGAVVQACGDYITSFERSENYEASPSGALIHWVHSNTRPGDPHECGFLVINGKVFGQKKAEKPRRGPVLYSDELTASLRQAD